MEKPNNQTFELLTMDEIAELTSAWSLAKNPSPFDLARMVEEKFMEKNKW